MKLVGGDCLAAARTLHDPLELHERVREAFVLRPIDQSRVIELVDLKQGSTLLGHIGMTPRDELVESVENDVLRTENEHAPVVA